MARSPASSFPLRSTGTVASYSMPSCMPIMPFLSERLANIACLSSSLTWCLNHPCSGHVSDGRLSTLVGFRRGINHFHVNSDTCLPMPATTPLSFHFFVTVLACHTSDNICLMLSLLAICLRAVTIICTVWLLRSRDYGLAIGMEQYSACNCAALSQSTNSVTPSHFQYISRKPTQ